MRIIAHRGLLNGPDKILENHPDQIRIALNKGFDCEIDVWYKDEEFFLGHDAPQYKIDLEFLMMGNLWIHAKNLEALFILAGTNLNYFWHQEDDYTLTSEKYIWTYPGKELTEYSVMVMPERDDPEFKNLDWNCYGICTDFVLDVFKLYRQAQLPKSA